METRKPGTPFGRYSRELNQRHEWDGPLFRARFKNRVVEDEEYWRDLLAYIHLNPVKAGLATSPDSADFTSHAAYVGLAPRPKWLTCQEMLHLFGSLDAYRDRLHDLATGRIPMHPDWEVAAWNETRVSTAISTPPPAMGWSGSSEEETVNRAVSEVCRVTAADPNQIKTAQRGRPANKTRWVLAWWLTRPGRLTVTATARTLGIAVSGVTRMVALAKDAREADEQVEGWMTGLEGLAKLRRG